MMTAISLAIVAVLILIATLLACYAAEGIEVDER